MHRDIERAKNAQIGVSSRNSGNIRTEKSKNAYKLLKMINNRAYLHTYIYIYMHISDNVNTGMAWRGACRSAKLCWKCRVRIRAYTNNEYGCLYILVCMHSYLYPWLHTYSVPNVGGAAVGSRLMIFEKTSKDDCWPPVAWRYDARLSGWNYSWQTLGMRRGSVNVLFGYLYTNIHMYGTLGCVKKKIYIPYFLVSTL